MEELKITLKRSFIGSRKKHKEILRSLGFKKMNQSIVQKDSPALQGNIRRVAHMIDVQKVKRSKGAQKP